MCRPYSLARRAPTIAIAGSSGPPRLPRPASTSGGWPVGRSASAASSRGIVCVGAAMRRRSGYYTRRAVANHLALLHDRTARVAHARARSRAGGGRRIVGREVLLAGDELAAGEAHAVALRTHREEDGARI